MQIACRQDKTKAEEGAYWGYRCVISPARLPVGANWGLSGHSYLNLALEYFLWAKHQQPFHIARKTAGQ